MLRATLMTVSAALLLTAPAAATPLAYVIAELSPRDPAAYARDYAAKVTPLVTAHGGRYLARGGRVDVLEGAAPTARTIIIEFPSMTAARAFWDSPEYRVLGEVRKRLASGRVYLVEGHDAGH